jgi:hypothetical protein
MALPSQLAKYSGLIDLVVEALVREMKGEMGAKTDEANSDPGKGRYSDRPTAKDQQHGHRNAAAPKVANARS